jgi:ferredoxin
MRVEVTDECIACGLCTEICPEVFEMGDEIAVVKVDTVPADFEAAARDAADQCPVDAIKVQD